MDNSTATPQGYIQALTHTIAQLDLSAIEKAIDLILATYERGGTIYIFGNGGSGATASHMAGDFVKGVSFGLEKRFRMICLNDNFTGLSAYSNDISYDLIFVEPLKNFLQKGDLVIGISGSGNSRNVVQAFEYAASIGVETIALCGYKGGKIKESGTVAIHVPIENMEISEDLHLVVFHIIKNNIIARLHGGLGLNVGDVYLNRVV